VPLRGVDGGCNDRGLNVPIAIYLLSFYIYLCVLAKEILAAWGTQPDFPMPRVAPAAYLWLAAADVSIVLNVCVSDGPLVSVSLKSAVSLLTTR
jgi:hypothetical protein